MSGHGFHVHGPHDHAVEHASHGGDGFSNNIAVMTAILATVGATFGYLGGSTQNEAALLKNDAAIAKTEAANKWSHYQSKSNKQNLAELALVLPGVDKTKYESEIARYKHEKEEIQGQAKALEDKSLDLDRKSGDAMHQHHQWALATTAEQIAISLAAITLLTRRKWMMAAAYGVAAVGILLGAFAWLHIDPIGNMMGGGAAHGAPAAASAPAPH